MYSIVLYSIALLHHKVNPSVCSWLVVPFSRVEVEYVPLGGALLLFWYSAVFHSRGGGEQSNSRQSTLLTIQCSSYSNSSLASPRIPYKQIHITLHCIALHCTILHYIVWCTVLSSKHIHFYQFTGKEL